MPWTEEPGRLQPMGLQRVRHNWARTHMHKSTSQEASHKRRALSRAVGEDGADGRFLRVWSRKPVLCSSASPPSGHTSPFSSWPWSHAEAVANSSFSEEAPWGGNSEYDRSDGWNHNYEDQERKCWVQKAMRASCPYFCPWMWLHQFTLVSTLGKSEKLSGGWQITWTLPKRN